MHPRLPFTALLFLAAACRSKIPVAIAPAQAALPPPAPAPPVPVVPAPLARHVIIVSEDGLRPDAILKARVPTHAALLAEGSYTLNARTIRAASTLPSHAAMLSGFDVAAHGLFWNSWRPERGFIKVPTIFTAAGLASDRSAAFVGKRKLEHIAGPGSVDVFQRPGIFCKKVVAEATSHFVKEKPRFQFIHFSDPDERGHAVGWMTPEQLEAINTSDRCLGTLIAALKQSGLDRDTLLIVSSDHGGHGRNHSGYHVDDRMIPWIAWGVGVRRGHRLKTPVSTMDTAATALWALGYPPPAGLEGRVVDEAFAPVHQKK